MNFLKMIGAADHLLDNDWLDRRYDLIERVRFSQNKRPSGVSPGDRLVLYAAGWQRIFAIAIVTWDAPVYDPQPGEERWPWVLGVEVPIAVPRLDLAPPLSALTGVASTSVRQQSHIRLDDADYQRAVQALVRPVQP